MAGRWWRMLARWWHARARVGGMVAPIVTLVVVVIVALLVGVTVVDLLGGDLPIGSPRLLGLLGLGAAWAVARAAATRHAAAPWRPWAATVADALLAQGGYLLLDGPGGAGSVLPYLPLTLISFRLGPLRAVGMIAVYAAAAAATEALLPDGNPANMLLIMAASAPQTVLMGAVVRRLDRAARERDETLRQMTSLQQRHERLLQDIDAIVWETDAATRAVTFVSQRVEAILGYSREQWHRPGFWRGVIHPEDRSRVHAAADRGLAGDEAFEIEYRVLAADGRTVWLHDLVRPIHDAHGTLRSFLGVMIDITSRRRAQEEATFLADATALLNASLDEETTLNLLGRLTIPLLADWCIIDRLEPDGTPRQVTVVHADPARAERIRALRQRYPLDPSGPHPVARVARTGESVVMPTIDDAFKRAISPTDEYLATVQTLGYRSALCVPLRARGRILGTLLLIMAESGRRFSTDDLPLPEDLAHRAALAIDNARLYATEQAARARLAFLAEAGQRLAESLDQATILATVARQAVPMLGDWCAVELVDDEGRLTAAAVAHPDPLVERALQEAASAAIGRPARPGGAEGGLPGAEEAMGAAVSGGPAVAHTAAEEALFRERGAPLMVAVPLMARGRWLGTLRLFRWRADGVAFDTDDREVAAHLGQRAAQALENARLYEESRATLLALRHSQAQVIQAGKLAAVGTLAAGVAHELNQPLMVIRGQAQVMLAAPPEGPRLAHKLRMIERQTEKMAAIIDHLRAFGRSTEVGQGVAVEVNAVVRDALLFLGAHLREQTIALQLDLAEPSPVAWADANQVEQILLNLLINARDAIGAHLPDDARPREIVIRSRAEGATVALIVTDSGPGLADGVAERLFEPFFTTKPVGQGTGLGLSISRDLARRWGGDLTLANCPGERGAAAVLTLPSAPAARSRPMVQLDTASAD